MNLCSINHLVLFFIMLVIVFIVHKMFYNKKNIETFTNAGWKLNHDGQLCNESLGCHSIGTITSNNKVCDVSGSNCVDMKIQEDEDVTEDNPDDVPEDQSQPVDCVEGSGVELGSCIPDNGYCGSGTQTRTRTGDVEAINGGSACSGTSLDEQICEGVPCPVDCQMGSWAEWGSCASYTGSCGSDAGSRTRTRLIEQEGSNGGSACGPTTETESCDLEPCPVPSDCEMTWGSWTCEVEGSSCGSGVQTRYGSVSQPAENGGSCGSNIEYGSSCNVDCDGSA